MNGDSHSGNASSNTRVAVQLSKNGADPQIRCRPLPPRIPTHTLVISSTTRCVATITAKVINGMTSSAVKSFDRTVSKSVDGMERQKSMLLSLRSA